MTIAPSRPLFIFEMANNHMGSLAHGLRIVREFHDVAAPFKPDFQFAFKLQYRHLETFLHPAYRDRNDVKYVKRFRETKLEDGEFLQLKTEMERLGFLSICTPFDETSVGRLEEHGVAMLKIASCSFTDWPLLERIAQSERPMIASTAGVPLEDIDRVVSFFQHRQKDLSLLHCVAEYPTRFENMQLNQIDFLRSRYPGVAIGFSTHENPDETEPVQMALAKGARIFEKHVGVPTDSAPLNAYSANPSQTTKWLAAASRAHKMCGLENQRSHFTSEELFSLHSLRRGVFAKETIRAGESLTSADNRIFLAMPTQPGQLTANDLSKYVTFLVQKDIQPGGPVISAEVLATDHRAKINSIVDRVNDVIQHAKVVVPGQAELEISHHYGVDQFDSVGATIINLVNREYCKKLIVMLPGQRHPEHCHKVKEETFLILHGDITISLEGVSRKCGPGDLLVVERGMRHSFSTEHGLVMEEISSTHHKGDSYYTDPLIAPVDQRKTQIAHWLGTQSTGKRVVPTAA
jgi:sialic acid synthase SpsE/quercetin dioxygenase-like cupin family protein